MTTNDLLAELRATQTMARVVEAAAHSERPYVVVPAQAVTAWMQREPDAWAKAPTGRRSPRRDSVECGSAKSA